MTVHLLSQLSPSQTLRVTHFELHCCFLSTKIFKKKVWVFFLTLCFSCFCVFPSWIFAFLFDLSWVYVSAVVLCPCLASGGYWFILNLFKLLVLVFIMWLSLRLGFVICRLPILSDLILMCCFKMFLFWLLGLLCWLCACLSSVCICLSSLGHFILIKLYVSLTYICPLGDFNLCCFNTLLHNASCS